MFNHAERLPGIRREVSPLDLPQARRVPSPLAMMMIGASLFHRSVAGGVALALLAFASVLAPPSSAQVREPFGLTGRPAPEGPLWERWRSLTAALDAEAITLATCRADLPRCTNLAATRFIAMIGDARLRQGSARIGWINRDINLAVQWTPDPVQHGVPEFWMTPLETLATGRGDCMDYAIAKYVALRELDTASADLRLLIVWDIQASNHHAVVAVYHDGSWLILDNRTLAIAPDTAFRHLVPLFSLTDNGVMRIDLDGRRGLIPGNPDVQVLACQKHAD